MPGQSIKMPHLTLTQWFRVKNFQTFYDYRWLQQLYATHRIYYELQRADSVDVKRLKSFFPKISNIFFRFKVEKEKSQSRIIMESGMCWLLLQDTPLPSLPESSSFLGTDSVYRKNWDSSPRSNTAPAHHRGVHLGDYPATRDDQQLMARKRCKNTSTEQILPRILFPLLMISCSDMSLHKW